MAFAATSLSSLQQLCKVDNEIFLHGRRERLFVSELNNKYLKIFKNRLTFGEVVGKVWCLVF